eukprot:NODE_4094_length_1938_cov_3.127002.p1 GENE.NODE_4094_length_1938_cov_3.127002~~NODE_4094_length_1938_cov_3.127002.p1  ORF type:complete len:454 (+),score=153.46 NODE_4094_length_1938_cov_3.127002:276-1637(+)
MEDVAVAEKDEVPVAVELTEEEKAQRFPTSALHDVSEKELAKCYTRFALPTKEEGFDSIEYPWAPMAQCEQHFADWVLHRKRTLRVEGLQPNEWFNEKWAEWQKTLQAWRKNQNEWQAGRKKVGKEEEEKVGKEEVEIVDVMAVADVLDIGGGEPLCSRFEFEDWCLISLRAELHLLLHGFRRALDDADRPSFSEEHLPFYYQRFFKKPFEMQLYGNATSAAAVIAFARDVAVVGAKGLLEAKLQDDRSLDVFMRLAEDNRRDRCRRMEAGDETAALKFTRPSQKLRHAGKGGQTGQAGQAGKAPSKHQGLKAAVKLGRAARRKRQHQEPAKQPHQPAAPPPRHQPPQQQSSQQRRPQVGGWKQEAAGGRQHSWQLAPRHLLVPHRQLAPRASGGKASSGKGQWQRTGKQQQSGQQQQRPRQVAGGAPQWAGRGRPAPTIVQPPAKRAHHQWR